MALEAGTQQPGIQSPGQPGVPGNIGTTRPAGAQAAKQLMRLMGQGMIIMGNELQKDRPDPAVLARGSAMISQADQAKRGMIQSQPQPGVTNLAPSTGAPRPVDGTMDPLTHQGGGGMGQGPSPFGAELGR